jgi:hypothetical protein
LKIRARDFVELAERRRGMKRINVFWGLPFTAFSYGLCILVLSLVGTNPISFYTRGFSTGIKFLILGAFAIFGLPGILRALKNTKILIRDIENNVNVDKDKLAVKIIQYTVAFEIVCILGFLSFFLEFPILWSIIGLIVGTMCKLYYVPIFLRLNKL